MYQGCISDVSNITKDGRIAKRGTKGMARRHIGRRMQYPVLKEEPNRCFFKRAMKSHNPECPLSHTILVIDPVYGKRVCWAHFHEPNTLQIVGSAMPQGVSYFKPAYIKIVWQAYHKHYNVVCCYVDRSACVLLWQTDKLPKWAEPLRSPPRSG